MGRPLKGDAYTNAIKRAKNPPQRVLCECGKYVTEDKLDSHQKTDYHSYLLRLKSRL